MYIRLLIAGKVLIRIHVEQGATQPEFGGVTPLLTLNLPLASHPTLGLEIDAKLPIAP